MKFFARQSRSAVQPQLKTAKLHIDHLEDRLTPSAFGPADGSYFVESWGGSYTDVKIQPSDQKIVAVGTINGMAIARYDAQGNNDATFGTNGVTSTSLGGSSVLGQGLALQADGKAVVSGYRTDPSGAKHYVARIKTNGTLDNTFGGGLGFIAVDFDPSNFTGSPMFNAVALQSTGKAVLASYEHTTNAGNPAVVSRFTTSGTLDTGKSGFGTVSQGKAIGYTFSSFGASQNYFADLVIQPDDKVVVVGLSANDGTGGFLVARYTANGVLDTTFNGTGVNTLLPAGATTARAFAITRQGDGKLVTVGYSTGVDGSPDLMVSRFNASGTLDTSFGAGNGYVLLDIDGTASQTSEGGRDVVIQPDGKIIVIGSEYAVNGDIYGPSSVLAARFNTDGTLGAR